MLDVAATILADAERGGRANGKETMARPRYQDGSLVVRGKRRKVWVLRWREDVLRPDGSVERLQRAETLGPVSKITAGKARTILQSRVGTANQGQRRPQAFMTLSDFVRAVWKPNAELGLRKSSVRYYSFQLDRHILPELGPVALCDLSRARVESRLSNLKRKGHAGATIRGVRATLSAVLEAAVEQQYLEKNPAHGIRIRETDTKRERRFYSPAEIRKVLAELAEPCRTIVLLAVLTGMRIGEILALRWKRVDLLRNTIEVAETFSDGQFGPPKTRSSCRVVPVSSSLRQAIEAHRARALRTLPDDLVFSTSKGTPLSPKNLYNRELAPACDRTKQPRVSWHSFRHAHATLLAEVGESLKTAQSILGHSDLETTLNTYMHAIPDSQRRAVERVGGFCSQMFSTSTPRRRTKQQ
jgi:integrase